MTARYLPDGWTLPALNEHNAEFFTRGELVLERCALCGHVQHPPTGVCVACQSLDTAPHAVEPHGTIDAWTIVHHPVNPLLRDRVPYNVVVVVLDEFPHVRLIGNLIDGQPAAGLPVRGTFTDPLGEHGIRLLQWERHPNPDS